MTWKKIYLMQAIAMRNVRTTTREKVPPWWAHIDIWTGTTF